MKKGKSGGNLIKGRDQGGKRISILITIFFFEILESSPRQGFRVSVEALVSLLVSVLQRYTLTSSVARSFRSSIGTSFAEIGIYPCWCFISFICRDFADYNRRWFNHQIDIFIDHSGISGWVDLHPFPDLSATSSQSILSKEE